MNTLSFLIRILSAAVWHLETIRARRQCAADHAAAERRMGELLRETERAKAGRKPLVEIIGTTAVPIPPTLAELGITKNESSKAGG